MRPNAWWRRVLRWLAELGLHTHRCEEQFGNPEFYRGFPVYEGPRHPIVYLGPPLKLPDTCPLSGRHPSPDDLRDAYADAAVDFIDRREAQRGNGGCLRRLKDGQWWRYCGETDMGQTEPALCSECGGTFELDEHERRAWR